MATKKEITLDYRKLTTTIRQDEAGATTTYRITISGAIGLEKVALASVYASQGFVQRSGSNAEYSVEPQYAWPIIIEGSTIDVAQERTRYVFEDLIRRWQRAQNVGPLPGQSFSLDALWGPAGLVHDALAMARFRWDHTP